MPVTNRDIYNNSLALIGEDISGINLEDYEERAPYLIASFCSLNTSLDKKIRTMDGLDAAFSFSPVYLSLDLDFPLCDRLTSAAALYTASMLVIDEDPDLSDSLYDKYCDNIASTESYYTLPKTSEPTTDQPTVTPPETEEPEEPEEPEEFPMATCESIVERYFFD